MYDNNDDKSRNAITRILLLDIYINIIIITIIIVIIFIIIIDIYGIINTINIEWPLLIIIVHDKRTIVM